MRIRKLKNADSETAARGFGNYCARIRKLLRSESCKLGILGKVTDLKTHQNGGPLTQEV